MNQAEMQQFSDVVKLVNRTIEPLEFKWDSQVYVVLPGQHLFLPRFIAMKAVSTHFIDADPVTGQTLSSLFGIDDPRGQETGFPIDPVDITPKELIEKDRSGVDEVMIGGKMIKKKALSFNNPIPREPVSVE